MEVRIETEFLSIRQRPFKPCANRLIRNVADGVKGVVHLVTDLQCIAAIDKQGGLLREHDGKAGGSGEIGQPGQALSIGCNKLTLILVAARHHAAIDADTLQMSSKRG